MVNLINMLKKKKYLRTNHLEKIYSGDKIKGKIEGIEIEGELYYEDESWFFLQNIKNGKKPDYSKKLENYIYKYSWCFKPESNPGEFSDRVEIGSKNVYTKGVYKEIFYDSSNDLNNKRKVLIRKIIVDKKLVKKIEVTTLFRIINHPDCCGVLQLYNFSNEDNNISKKEIKIIKETILKTSKNLTTAYLTNRQTEAVKLIKELGFIKVNTFKNKNSNNIVYVYNYYND